MMNYVRTSQGSETSICSAAAPHAAGVMMMMLAMSAVAVRGRVAALVVQHDARAVIHCVVFRDLFGGKREKNRISTFLLCNHNKNITISSSYILKYQTTLTSYIAAPPQPLQTLCRVEWGTGTATRLALRSLPAI